MTEKILIVDDEPTVRRVISRCLRASGYEVDTPAAETEEGTSEATRAVELGRYDLLLLDLRLPHINTIELVERLRRERNPLQVMIVAGFLPAEIHKRLSNLGIQHFLEKPFQLSSLLHEVREALQCCREPG